MGASDGRGWSAAEVQVLTVAELTGRALSIWRCSGRSVSRVAGELRVNLGCERNLRKTALVAKTADGDFLREMIRSASQRLMELEG